MIKTKVVIYILFLFTTLSCTPSWDLSELYVLKIENTSKVIYKYDAWGGRDSHIFGIVILDSTETFDINNVETLPFSLLETIPTKELVLGIESDNSDYTKTKNEIHKPIKVTIDNQGGLKIKTKIFQYKGYSNRSGGLGRYVFEKFKETHDSIFFYNLDDVESMKPEHLDTLKFKKTNITIKKTEQNNVLQVDIQDLKLSQNDEILSNITYFLKPKKTISINAFTNIGIFKELNRIK
ncbi:hypothetical protein [Flavobacterium sp. Root186]|uniref:hypothetical protein n=1 Tax=Flavobacterium sp. Root186 TaxID=1736485 RepID=UPI000AA9245D|nr:hypothetical protein [Flavobacterium sp. Root186]